MVAAIAACVAAWYLLGIGPILYAVVALAVLVIVRHHTNIAKLLRGEESKIGASKKVQPAP
jgi:glycerol-3-phosphate acyltransferase PlsY